MTSKNDMNGETVRFWKSVWNDIKDNYRSAWAFALACPILFLIPTAVEMYQHIIEINLGMYDGLEIAKSIENDDSRLQAGFYKVAALLLPAYWFTRYIISDQNAAFARKIAWPAIAMFGALYCVQLLEQYWMLFGPTLAEFFHQTGNAANAINWSFDAMIFILGIYWSVWFVALSLGNGKIGPITSITVMIGNFWRAMLYLIAAVIPLMIAHYALGAIAIYFNLPTWIDYIILTLDSIVVGFLALTMTGSMAIIARYAAKQKDLQLMV